MEPAIGTCFDYQVTLNQQLAEMAASPFGLISLGGDAKHSGYLSATGRLNLLRLSKQFGIAIDSLHVPFSVQYDLSCSHSARRVAAVCRVASCIEAAKELGARTVIFHLNSFGSEIERDSDSLMQSLEALTETAANMQIRVAAENLWGQRSLEFLHIALTGIKSDYFGFCYDSSHDQLSNSEPYRILEQYVDRLFAVHLSDNDGKDDRHWLPFTGIVDWERICRTLSDSGYGSPLLLEVENNDGVPTGEFLKRAGDAASMLLQMIDSEKGSE